MNTRRGFLKKSALFSSMAGVVGINSKAISSNMKVGKSNQPIVISTWPHGIPANEAAWEILNNGGKAIDAVEKGVMVPEGDPNVKSVGYGG